MSVQDVVKKISWLGHDGFRIDGAKTIYIDPYEIAPGAGADLVLVTHEHFDHCSPADIEKIQKGGTVVVTEKMSAEKLPPGVDVRVVKPGEAITVAGISIETVPAYNTNKNFHPQSNGWLGFILEAEGVRVYHAGDTDFIPEMASLDVDIALLPVSGTYVMTADEAVQAALAIRPALAIPMHYGAIVGEANDAETFKAGLAGKVEVQVLAKSA